VPDPGGQWPPRSISLRLFFLLKLCQLLEKVESRDAPGLRVWLLGGTLDPSKGARDEPGWAGTENTFRGNRSSETFLDFLSFHQVGGSKTCFRVK